MSVQDRPDYKTIKNMIKGQLLAEKTAVITLKETLNDENANHEEKMAAWKTLSSIRGKIEGLRYAIKVIQKYNS